MIRRFFLCVCVLLWPYVTSAQEAAVAQDVGVTQDADWLSLAARAEILAARRDVSTFAISRLRAELVIWRDVFAENGNVNAGRISTVDVQLSALGTIPENGEEATVVAMRRTALLAQRQTLMAPRLLAQEAFARADGLIGEFDAYTLHAQTREMTKRGPLPLTPAYLVSAVVTLWQTMTVIGVETTAGLRQSMSSGDFWVNAPSALLLVVVGIALLGMARRWITNLRADIAKLEGRFLPLWLFVLSLAQMFVPLSGLFVLTRGLEALNIFGVRGAAVVDAIPMAGFFIIFGWWLCRHLFPSGLICAHLGYDISTRAVGRRYGLAIAWMLAVGSLLDAALSTAETAEGTLAALEFPVVAVIGVLLILLGRVVSRKPDEALGEARSQGRVRLLLGRACIMVGVAVPILAALGFAAAARGLADPWVMSLGLIGVVFILQRVVSDLNIADPENSDVKGAFALLPVVIDLTIYVISLPIMALIWGAHVSDLTELWSRFREGFAIGDSRISPTDFITFAFVFGVGYMLTRLIKNTLRKSVMPRTRLDLGGQNAVVAGFGYIGVMLAAIAAITSAGIDLSNLAIVAGALSVGIGFGLQNIVSNFVSGIILLIERPVSEGDWIEVGGQMGYVRSISVRSTRIETFDRTDVIVPNADLVSGQVTNWTRGNLVGRIIVPVGVSYGSDVPKVTEILRGIAEAHPLVIMTPPPNILLQGFGADSLDFEIRAIIRDVNYAISVKSAMNYEIERQFSEAGIEIPFAQRDIWLRNPEVLKGGTI